MTPVFTGRIVEWDRERGHGWIETDGQRIFLHWRDFAERRKRAEVGDRVRFTAGQGPGGRICAQNAVHLNDGRRFGFLALLILVSLLVLPALAILRFQAWLNPSIAAAIVLPINAVTFAVYHADKRRAREKEWRISEATLHLLELAGGWPAAFVAQRRFRHKIRKVGYQISSG
jgi:uncharacterized membrane protein YsdA (DUF1294 family)/cold shock CspA family protein